MQNNFRVQESISFVDGKRTSRKKKKWELIVGASLALTDATEVEKFVQSNTQELAKDKWLCPLSGKKFKGPDFVRKHIFNKHAEKVEEVKKEVSSDIHLPSVCLPLWLFDCLCLSTCIQAGKGTITDFKNVKNLKDGWLAAFRTT